MAIYFKSAIYLAVFGTAGYILMKVTEPNEEKLKKIQAYEGYGTDGQKKKAQFIERIKEATRDTPIYMKKKDSKEKDQKTEWIFNGQSDLESSYL